MLTASIVLRERNMGKKALIVARLVEESADCSNEEIEKEIYSELSKEVPRIPWVKEIEKVTVESN